MSGCVRSGCVSVSSLYVNWLWASVFCIGVPSIIAVRKSDFFWLEMENLRKEIATLAFTSKSSPQPG